MMALLGSLTRSRTLRLLRKNNGVGAAEVVAEVTTKTTTSTGTATATAKEGVTTNSATTTHGKSVGVAREDAVVSGKTATTRTGSLRVVRLVRQTREGKRRKTEKPSVSSVMNGLKPQLISRSQEVLPDSPHNSGKTPRPSARSPCARRMTRTRPPTRTTNRCLNQEKTAASRRNRKARVNCEVLCLIRLKTNC